MNVARYFGVGALVAGVAAFGMTDRAEAPVLDAPLAVLTPEPLRDLPAPEPIQPVAPIRETPPPSAPQRENVRRDDRDDRSSRRGNRGRWRNRNIYPGPIPTPAEWQPPEGPVRIALQAGHWRAAEAPPELEDLKGNGTRGGGKAEWEVNLAIARRAAEMLEEKGYVVDILPAIVPPGYRAHLFISIHADGALDTQASGYRVAAPRRDATGRAERMVALLEESYGRATGLKQLPTITRRMSSYYAFNFRRYLHALHPMTIGVIIETGFLTSPSDRRIIVSDPGRAARGIVEAVMAFPETAPPAPTGTDAGRN
jgi:N-acetylmuramoyl-L-alanine amidase